MDLNCIFCKLANGLIPTEFVYEDEQIVGFKDVSPQAPIHVLFMPKEHVCRASQASDETLSGLFRAARSFASEKGLEEQGYRLVINTGEMGGQSVDHLHMHFLSGRNLQWPPG